MGVRIVANSIPIRKQLVGMLGVWGNVSRHVPMDASLLVSEDALITRVKIMVTIELVKAVAAQTGVP